MVAAPRQQTVNHNTVSVGVGNGSEADAQGGNTTASSGNAYGGNGGNASAYGGDSNASNNAQVGQSNSANGPKGSGTEQQNELECRAGQQRVERWKRHCDRR